MDKQHSLVELQAENARLRAQLQRFKAVPGILGAVGGRILLGRELEKHARVLWDEVSAKLAGERATWPEAEMRDFSVALLGRVTRRFGLIFLIGIAVAVGFPISQVYLLAKQNALIVGQNELFARQTALIADQNATLASQRSLSDAQNELLELQNAEMQRQGNLSAFSQTSAIRGLLFQPPFGEAGNSIADYVPLLSHREIEPYLLEDSQGLATAQVHFSDADGIYPVGLSGWPGVNRALIQQLIDFARRDSLLVVEALSPLVRDHASSVSAGAVVALRALGIFKADSAYLPKAELSLARLDSMQLRGANLYVAKLSESNLSAADLTGATLIGAELYRTRAAGARFRNADLRYVDFYCADLRNADFRGANLVSANFYMADIRGANFRGAMMENSFGADGKSLLQNVKAANGSTVLADGTRMPYTAEDGEHTHPGGKVGSLAVANGNRFSRHCMAGTHPSHNMP